MFVKITNVKIYNAVELYKEIKDVVIMPTQFVLNLKNNNSKIIDMFYNTYLILKDSQNISFNVVEDKITKKEKEEIYKETELIDNVLVNKLGLTESEKWFNTLSDEHKKHVQYLSETVFNIIPTAG